MKLSTRSTYGMRALVELALASGHTPVSASVIARRQQLSVAYLEQLLHRLKKQGVVASIRGPKGGYTLARAPQEITMADVVGILEDQNGTKQPKPWSEGSAQGSRIAGTVLRVVHDRLTRSLETLTLQDLCE